MNDCVPDLWNQALIIMTVKAQAFCPPQMGNKFHSCAILGESVLIKIDFLGNKLTFHEHIDFQAIQRLSSHQLWVWLDIVESTVEVIQCVRIAMNSELI
ncbi:MAG: hypothetical protein CMN94_10605 [Synechococcus sp. EAC657]|nr:hypothetical protein [Synechococcus sp. EAC657]